MYSWIADILLMHGEWFMNSENSKMEKKSGDKGVPPNVIRYTVGDESWFELSQQPIVSPPIKFVSSKDLGDPEIGTVLQWHLSLCLQCQDTLLNQTPHAFGQSALQWSGHKFCSEYWEIIDEYREYEGHYAMRGNP